MPLGLFSYLVGRVDFRMATVVAEREEKESEICFSLASRLFRINKAATKSCLSRGFVENFWGIILHIHTYISMRMNADRSHVNTHAVKIHDGPNAYRCYQPICHRSTHRMAN